MGTLQARIVEWVAMPSSRGSSQPRDRTRVSHIAGGFFTSQVTNSCQCWRRKRCRLDPWVGKIPWRRAWQPTQVFLPREFHGQRSLAGCSPWGHKELDTKWADIHMWSEGWQRAEDRLNWVGWLGAWFARGKGEKTDEGKCQSWSEQAISYPVRWLFIKSFFLLFY